MRTRVTLRLEQDLFLGVVVNGPVTGSVLAELETIYHGLVYRVESLETA